MRNSLSFRTLVLSIVAILLILLATAFVLFQARHLLLGPQLTITETPDQVVNTKQVALAGSAKNISRLWLNDRPIFTDPAGNFREEIILENGYTIVTLRAEDRYGRSAIIEKPFVFTPASLIE